MKLLDAMAVECREAIKGTQVQAARIGPTHAELFLSSTEWLTMGSEERKEVERLMDEAFPDSKWSVRARSVPAQTKDLNAECLSAHTVLSSKPTAAEVAAEAQQRKSLEDGKSHARSACREKIIASLDDPNSAKFLDYSVVIDGERYLVTQEVRGKNAFGGVIKNTFECVVLPGSFQVTLLPRR